jgi:acetolactate synthase I/II/III large subunit
MTMHGNGFVLTVLDTLNLQTAFTKEKIGPTLRTRVDYMMNSQEIEAALPVGMPMVVLIWNDSEYGLITWHQLRRFGRPSHIEFNNPDFVRYAESFGAKGYRIERAADLVPTLKQALADNTVAIIDCPMDYSENMKLTEKLSRLKSPV